jgi:PAS domain S-box-containing protein
MWVASGTQVSAALTVIVEPILSGDQVPGVLELALMRPEDNATLALLDEIMPVVALSLEALAARLRTQTEFARHLQELEQCDRQLQDSERRLRTLFETANEGIWIIDAATQTTDLNPAMAAILGLPREAVLGRPIFEFVDAANEAIFREQLKHRQQGETGAYEIALSRPDGSQIPCLFSASPLFNARGERVGSFAMVTDRMFSRGAGVG